jgi:hypothetical protein
MLRVPSQPLSPRKLTPGLTVNQTMDVIRTTVSKLEELTRGVSESRLDAVTDYGWSVNDQMAHLRSCQDVLGGNMLRIVREDRPAWKGTAPTARQKEYFGSEFAPAFAAFRSLRAEILEVLEPLPPEAWERTAIVSAPPGKVYENSVLYYGDWMARHERSHLRHIARILGEVA